METQPVQGSETPARRALELFRYMKAATTYAQAMASSLPLPNGLGYLMPVSELHATDGRLIEQFAAWRSENSFAFPSQFHVTFEGTKAWLRRNVLDTEDRLLFVVLDPHGRPLGHLGYANVNNDLGEMEIDNVVRGVKAVEPGLMAAAMQTLVQWAQTCIRPKRIFLRVLSSNVHAIEFYKRLGFDEDHREALRLIGEDGATRYLPVAANDTRRPDEYFVHMVYSAKPEADTKRKLVTLVIPARNEEANIARLEKAVNDVTLALDYDFEFIVVDNRSTDRTPDLVRDLCRRDSRWKYIRFSRDFSVEASITAGYHYASGSAIILLYSDLQDPPAVIPRFLEKWEEGYDVVYGVRSVRKGDPAWRNFLAKLAYRIIASMADVPIPVDAGDFRLIDRKVRDGLEKVTEANRYARGLIAWMGFKQTGIVYEREPRQAGISKGPFWYIFFIAVNAITSFSMKPLRIFLFFGSAMTVFSFAAIIIYLITYFFIRTVPGLTTLFLLSLLAIGLNSIGIGILGEYMGRTYLESKHRPIYVIDEMMGFGAASQQPDQAATGQYFQAL